MLRLGKINKNISPDELYKLVAKLSKTNYFLTKYGFSKSSFENIISSPGVNIENIKKNIKLIMHDTSSDALTIEIILTAIIRSNLFYKEILSAMSLSIEDLYDGIRFLRDKDNYIPQNQTLATDTIIKLLARQKNRQLFLFGDDDAGKTHLAKYLLPKSKYLSSKEILKLPRKKADKLFLESSISEADEILILDDANRLLEETSNTRDHSESLNSIILKNKKLILVINTKEYKTLKPRLPSIFRSFSEVRLIHFANEEAMKILFHWSIQYEKRNKIIIGYSAIKYAYELSCKITKTNLSIQEAKNILKKAAIYSKNKNITALEVYKYATDIGIVNNLDSKLKYFVFGTQNETHVFIENIKFLNENYRYYFVDLKKSDLLNFEKVLTHVLRYPQTILHLHNIDKSQPKVYSLIHQILDEDRYDIANKIVDFSKVIYIASNVLDDSRVSKYKDYGYDVSKLQSYFVEAFEPKEILNQFDEVIFLN